LLLEALVHDVTQSKAEDEMRLALNFQALAIEGVLQRHMPGLELVEVTATAAPVGPVDALLTPLVGTQSLARLLPTCQGLRWVHIFGTGADTFPFDLAAGLRVSCSRGASAVGIAEWVLAMMLCFEKQLPKTWVTAPSAQLFKADLGSLEGKTLGLLGFGAVGQALPRVRLSPHVSWSAPGTVERMLAFFLRNLGAFAQGKPLEGVVDVAAGY
jgi:phosphoglycerate dehydrogenase-like enzyme